MGQEETNEKLEQPAAPKPAENTQKPKTCLLTSILLAILAIGGIAFGVYGMILANQPHKCPTVNYNVDEDSGSETTDAIEVTCPDGTVTKVEKIIDDSLAQNLIAPYMELFGYLNNLLDYPFDDATKIVVAFQNIPIEKLRGESLQYNQPDWGSDYYMVSYGTINTEYQELFGSSNSLEKKDYNPGHSMSFVYSDEMGGVFKVSPFDGGGYGSSMLNVIKSASYSGNNLIIKVYHDQIPVCELADDEYCADSQNDFEKLIANFSDRIPVYTMTFTQDNGHYVLSNVEKQ